MPRTASCCSRRRPRSPTEALQIADRRLYLDKGERQRASVTRQTGDVLLQALQEREPDLRGHVGVVGRLAEATADGLGLGREERERIALAAQLHDVGKMAVPDAILAKPGPLDEGELSFIRQHTVVGERILRAAPALGRVAPLVRSSHERFDGTRLPRPARRRGDPARRPGRGGLRRVPRDDQPRPYSPARRVEEALAELRRCAGAQFDPVVVDAFCAALARHGRNARAEARGRRAAPRRRSPSPARRVREAPSARSRRRPRGPAPARARASAASASMLSDTERS